MDVYQTYLLLSISWWFFSCVGRNFRKVNSLSQCTQLSQIYYCDLCQSYFLTSNSSWFFSCLGRHFKKVDSLSQDTQWIQIYCCDVCQSYFLISNSWWFFSCLGRHFKKVDSLSQYTQLIQISPLNLFFAIKFCTLLCSHSPFLLALSILMISLYAKKEVC